MRTLIQGGALKPEANASGPTGNIRTRAGAVRKQSVLASCCWRDEAQQKALKECRPP